MLKTTSPRCRLPLDGVVLNALHSVDKEFVNKGTLRTFKASDDEKFQISSDQFCTPPHLDENAEEGLTSCNAWKKWFPTLSKAFNASSRSSSILTLAIYEVSKTPCDIWRNVKASDDEKFQISSDQFCTPPHLDENAEEGLTSCNVQQGQNKGPPVIFHYQQ
jgi:hypothetical protein